MIETRPWGRFEILIDEVYTKVKRITVTPRGILSYQFHHERDETWIIVSGEGIFTLNDKTTIVKYGDTCQIKRLDKHRIENIGKTDLIFIEVQTGKYFGEDDIIRIQDNYYRL